MPTSFGQIGSVFLFGRFTWQFGQESLLQFLFLQIEGQFSSQQTELGQKMRQTKVESDGGFNNEGNVIFFQGMISQVDRNVVFCDWFVTTI